MFNYVILCYINVDSSPQCSNLNISLRRIKHCKYKEQYTDVLQSVGRTILNFYSAEYENQPQHLG